MTIARMRPGAATDRGGWSTPAWLFRHYDDRFRFTVDLAAEAWNAKCTTYLSVERDAFRHPWTGRGWLNPPYSDIEPWCERAYLATHTERLAEAVVLLLPVRTSRRWFQDLVRPYAQIEWLDQRICFDPPPGYEGKKDSPAEDSLVATFERPWMPRGRKNQRGSLGGLAE